jgi:hypothetical protein
VTSLAAAVRRDATISLDRCRSAHRRLFRWCLGRAERSHKHGQDEESARWLLVGAELATVFGCGALASPALEARAVDIGLGLDWPAKDEAARPARGLRWLHVMSLAYPIGGHTALVRRWIENDESGDAHSLLITWMSGLEIPALAGAVRSRGGTVRCLGAIESLLDRARALRAAAWRGADRVVLHIHNWDVIPSIAFAVDGGPPVLLVNHADHAFWVGGGIADVVINIRESGEDVNVRHRGLSRNAILPPSRSVSRCVLGTEGRFGAGTGFRIPPWCS